MAFLIALLALAAPAAADRPVEILVRRAGGGLCEVRIEGRTYKAPGDGVRVGAHLASLKARERRARLVLGPDVPYRCVGGIIFDAQRLDLRFGFIAEPGRGADPPLRSGS
jgi:hypothetical protein